MHSVSFPGHRYVNVPAGARLIDALRLGDFLLDTPCGGTGICGKCKLQLAPGSAKHVRSEESPFLSPKEQADDIVLACRTKIFGDITVLTPILEDNTLIDSVPSNNKYVARINPNITKQYISENDITLVKAQTAPDSDIKNALCEEPGNTSDLCYGLSLDVGTTTLSLSLIDLISGECLDSVSALNPQVSYGFDIITRIQFAEDIEGLETLKRVLLNKINQMILIISENTTVNRNNIYEAVFSGNPCMLHLVSGINPSGLTKYPFDPVIKGAVTLKAAEFGLNISDSGLIYFPPPVSAYIGADITSGLLAFSLFNAPCLTLFIDIGTNGEIALASKSRIIVTSTAAGPAFEGAAIKYGMRAEKGAIEAFNISSDNNISIRIIGCEDLPQANGICGSGLIDIIAELVRQGVILKNGGFESKTALPDFLGEQLSTEDGETVFKITGAVSLSQNDIRQIQLAKGAIRAGIELLLTAVGVEAQNVEKVLVAGAFGYHTKVENLIKIGLLPELFSGKIHCVGNSSLEGGVLFLMDHRRRREMELKVCDIDVIQLANTEDFMEEFIQSLDF